MSVKVRSFPQLSDIDLKFLRIFSAIVKNDGFSSAQYELNMSLPAISSAMAQLEDRIGFKLCERGRGGFQLTEGGGLVCEELQTLLEAIDRFQSAVHRFKGDLHGQIAIAVDDAPNLDVNLTIMSPPKMEKSLIENHLTSAIGPFRETSDTLEATQLYEETQLLCCAKGRPAFGLTDRQQIDDAIAKSDYAARNYNDESYNLDDLPFSKSLTASNMEFLLALVLTGKCAGYLPRHFCEGWIAKGEIRALLPEFYAYMTPIYAVYRKNHNDPRISLFLEALKAHT